ncbi:MAG TPA: response regulator [Pyrinomonadaceae bacterium]|nr:response regulator [Pyrinomonadaceae bacterium]
MASILLVNDDEQFRNTLSETLRRAGYKVLEAHDGAEGLRFYRKHATDLMITNLIMPEKEGLEIIQELRRHDPEVKIIAISSGARHGSDDYATIAKTFGLQRVLAKPFSRQEMLDAVWQVLEAQEQKAWQSAEKRGASIKNIHTIHEVVA